MPRAVNPFDVDESNIRPAAPEDFSSAVEFHFVVGVASVVHSTGIDMADSVFLYLGDSENTQTNSNNTNLKFLSVSFVHSVIRIGLTVHHVPKSFCST